MDLDIDVLETKMRRFRIRGVSSHKEGLDQINYLYENGFASMCGRDLGKSSWAKNGIYDAPPAPTFVTCENCKGERCFGRGEGHPTFDCPVCQGLGTVELVKALNEQGENDVNDRPLIEEQKQVDLTVKQLVAQSYNNSASHGFYDGPPPNIMEKFMLMVGEIGEASEEHRKGQHPTAIYYSTDKDGRQKPEGIPVELADAVIRIADFCGYFGIDLAAAIQEKHEYNAGRPYKHNKVC